ncbi:MAG TPA: ATP-dependent zinc metalloprotease FtsH [Candidatus Binatia bacterium]|nr:ATP-dependent zinc metalloprotease FtsH [Candidatus Binatia bacterium]
MNMPPPSEEKSNPQLKPRPPSAGSIILWWIICLGLLVWNVANLRLKKAAEINVPYTVFLEQVRADNVARVQILGDKITGSFVKPVPWPEKKPANAPPATSKSTAEKVAPAAPTTYSEFETTFPAAIGDSTLLPLLEQHKVVVGVSSSGSPWFLELLANWFPTLLLVGFFWWMSVNARNSQSGLFGLGRTKARRYNAEQAKITFNDVAGADEAKAELQEEVDFLKRPQKYHDLGARIPRGVLLVGPPGTGKTLLAKAIAGEAGVPFFSLSASEFVEMFVGVGASRMRDLFTQAKAAAPAILFIDELDAVGRRRGAGVGAVNDEREQTLNQFLVEMDGFDDRNEVIVLAATNRPDVLDPALLRPGRFDRQVVVGLPDHQGREGILRIHTRKLRLAANVDLLTVSRATMGFSGADLANLCNEAALVAARHNRTEVVMADFEEAQDKILLGGAQPSLIDPHERRAVAIHESGHALVAWLSPAADPVRKVTIVPHGHALGVTEQLPQEDQHNYTVSYLTARLAVMLGGRGAEDIVIGDISTGAENDLVEATRLARRMAIRWGMGKLGVMAFQHDEHQPFLGSEISQGRVYSEATAAQIDNEVQQLLEERYQAVRRLLLNARPKLDRLVNVLLQEETVAQERLVEILGPRPVLLPTAGTATQSIAARNGAA